MSTVDALIEVTTDALRGRPAAYAGARDVHDVDAGHAMELAETALGAIARTAVAGWELHGDEIRIPGWGVITIWGTPKPVWLLLLALIEAGDL